MSVLSGTRWTGNISLVWPRWRMFRTSTIVIIQTSRSPHLCLSSLRAKQRGGGCRKYKKKEGRETHTQTCCIYSACSSCCQPPVDPVCQSVVHGCRVSQAANSKGINHDLTTMRQLTYYCFMTRGERYGCFKRLAGNGTRAEPSRACSLVIGPYNGTASALPLTSQLGGPPSPSVPFIRRGPPALQPSPASAPRIAQAHTARPQHQLTASVYPPVSLC